MKKLAVVLLSTLFAFSPIALAQGSVQTDFENFQKLANTYNSNSKVPGIFKGLMGSERINFHISADGATNTFSIITDKNGKAVTISQSAVDKPTISVNTKREVLTKLAGVKEPIKATAQSLAKKEVTFKGVDGLTAFKIWLINLAIGVGFIVLPPAA